MSWRQVPPVLSPVPVTSLPAGIAAAWGVAPSADEFEPVAAIRARYGATDVVLTDSGTSALILALQALVPAGGTVAYPAYACIDLTAAALGAGMRVRLYDLDPATLSPDPDSVRAVIERGVDAIVVAHLFGYPADVFAVQRIAADFGIPVLEDAAQGAGGSLFGKPLGSLADISILSFGRGKGVTAGSGGAIMVRTPALAEWAHRVRISLGVRPRGGREILTLAAQWLFSHPLLYRLPASIPALKLGEMVYRAPRTPRRMSAAATALLPEALRLDERATQGRRARANDLLSVVGACNRMSPVRVVAGGESGYLRLATLDSKRNSAPNVSIGAVRGYPVTLEEHAELRPILAPSERAGRGATHLRDSLFTLPTHHRVCTSDVLRLAKWMTAPEPDSLPGFAAAGAL
jgi:perosamine synthetase